MKPFCKHVNKTSQQIQFNGEMFFHCHDCGKQWFSNNDNEKLVPSKDQLDSESIARFDSASLAVTIFAVVVAVIVVALGFLGAWKAVDLIL